jgi:putative transposase
VLAAARGCSGAACCRGITHHFCAPPFLPITDLLFQQVYAFFVIETASRRVVHVGVTRHPTDAWVTQQLREATPFDKRPKYLIRDNDAKFGPVFTRLAEATGIELLRTPYRAPLANAICERFLGSLRRACLDHVIILNEQHLRRVLHEYIAYFNVARPHQGIEQQRPDTGAVDGAAQGTGPVTVVPVLGGLHHDYRRAA